MSETDDQVPPKTETFHRSTDQVSCVVLGEGSLPLQCAKILQQNGFQLKALISPDLDVRNWATKASIATSDPETSELLPFLQSLGSFDFIFSISNFIMLPQAVLNLARRAAINYHDGPLPRYAGMHATSWALMQGEQEHAISWHIMLDSPDTGDLLAQVSVPVDPHDTAIKLNFKCYVAAIRGFTQLVLQLKAGTEQRVVQDLSQRTYFAYYERPAGAGVLLFNQPAETLYNLVRGLDFGRYENPMGTPRLMLNDDFYVVTSASVKAQESKLPPGYVVEQTQESVTLATTTKDFCIHSLTTLGGKEVAFTDLVQRWPVEAPLGPTLETFKQLSKVNDRLSKHEIFWLQRITSNPRPTFFESSVDHQCSSQQTTILMQDSLVGTAIEIMQTFVNCLVKACAEDRFLIAYRDARTNSDWENLEGLFSTYVPMQVGASESLEEELEILKKRESFALDIFSRYLKIAPFAVLYDEPWSVAIERVSDIVEAKNGAMLNLTITPEHFILTLAAAVNSLKGQQLVADICTELAAMMTEATAADRVLKTEGSIQVRSD